MNHRQLQYAVMLAQVRNFSQVAEALSISQPALSKQILHLEQELGVKLFDRTTQPLTLTPAGERFVQEAEALLYRKDQLLRSMERFRSGEEGRLVIGISPFRSQYLMPGFVKKMRTRFPGLQIFLHETGSDALRKEAAEGKYDFAIVNLPVEEALLDVTPLEPDTLVLSVPNEMLPLLPDPSSPLRLEDCARLPFVVVGQNQEMRQLFDRMCIQAGLHPNIAMEVVGLSTAWTMSCAGIGAALLPLQFVTDEMRDRAVTLFTLANNSFSRQPAIVKRRGQYLSEYARYAIALLTDKAE